MVQNYLSTTGKYSISPSYFYTSTFPKINWEGVRVLRDSQNAKIFDGKTFNSIRWSKVGVKLKAAIEGKPRPNKIPVPSLKQSDFWANAIY